MRLQQVVITNSNSRTLIINSKTEKIKPLVVVIMRLRLVVIISSKTEKIRLLAVMSNRMEKIKLLVVISSKMEKTRLLVVVVVKNPLILNKKRKRGKFPLFFILRNHSLSTQ
jgi:Na+/serine symporter